MASEPDRQPQTELDTGDPAETAAVGAPDRARHNPSAAERAVAVLEVLLCSDYPTQLALGSTLATLGFQAQTASGSLDLTYIVVLSLADTFLLLGLIVLFL